MTLLYKKIYNNNMWQKISPTPFRKGGFMVKSLRRKMMEKTFILLVAILVCVSVSCVTVSKTETKKTSAENLMTLSDLSSY